MYSLRNAPINAEIAHSAGLKAYKKHNIKKYMPIFPMTH